MRRSVQNMSARKVSTILSALTVMTWAVLFAGAAPSSVRAQASRIQQTLSGGRVPARGGPGQEASVRDIALGERTNHLPGRATVLVTDALPPDLDGVLDPSESYYPLGYVIDLPAGTLTAFDPRVTPLRSTDEPAGG